MREAMSVSLFIDRMSFCVNPMEQAEIVEPLSWNEIGNIDLYIKREMFEGNHSAGQVTHRVDSDHEQFNVWATLKERDLSSWDL
tara:strand:- start:227 stop:478 length:252 start_codon:yes stop_codon:yes gene_type:complete